VALVADLAVRRGPRGVTLAGPVNLFHRAVDVQ
jgi:hypothetical protein